METVFGGVGNNITSLQRNRDDIFKMINVFVLTCYAQGCGMLVFWILKSWI